MVGDDSDCFILAAEGVLSRLAGVVDRTTYSTSEMEVSVQTAPLSQVSYQPSRA